MAKACASCVRDLICTVYYTIGSWLDSCVGHGDDRGNGDKSCGDTAKWGQSLRGSPPTGEDITWACEPMNGWRSCYSKWGRFYRFKQWKQSKFLRWHNIKSCSWNEARGWGGTSQWMRWETSCHHAAIRTWPRPVRFRNQSRQWLLAAYDAIGL